jgi:hypothetical protein
MGDGCREPGALDPEAVEFLTAGTWSKLDPLGKRLGGTPCFQLKDPHLLGWCSCAAGIFMKFS